MPQREMKGPSAKYVRYAKNLSEAAKKYAAAKKIQSAWRRRSKPSRLYSGKSTYRQTKVITNRVMKNLSESKYAGARVDCIDTVVKPYGTPRPMSYVFLNTGATVTNHPEFATPLNLFRFNQGTGGAQRVGDYMYLKHTTLKMEITNIPQVIPDDNTDAYLNAPVRCRLMIVKANRKNNKFGTSPDPSRSLFIDTQNGAFGYGETAGSINLLMKQPINTRKWIKYMDKSFTLTPYVIDGVDAGGRSTAVPSGRGYSSKRISVRLPVYKKTHFDSASATPDDVDTQWFIVLQCVRECHCLVAPPNASRPQGIRMEILGTTSALDN